MINASAGHDRKEEGLEYDQLTLSGRKCVEYRMIKQALSSARPHVELSCDPSALIGYEYSRHARAEPELERAR